MTSTVRFFIALSMASCTMPSLSASKALVASSRRRMRGLRSSARAIAILCFWPPDNWTPRSPTSVSYPSGKELMNSCAFARRAASIMSSMGISCSSSRVPGDSGPLVGLYRWTPNVMLSLMLLAKRTGSWLTKAM
mmetsp:Transcript_110992/g.192438  ORF Transcript_110992/g.192438 Transcript_110992/m.192438 type:complete len:135 (+) Transcript_110992:175-579(+)